MSHFTSNTAWMELSDEELLGAMQRLPEANALRAEIRAKVYTTLMQRNGPIKANLPKPDRGVIKADPNYGLAVEVLRDFLNVRNLVNTLSVFKPEAELQAGLTQRKVLEDRLKVQTGPRQSLLEALIVKVREMSVKGKEAEIVTRPFNPVHMGKPGKQEVLRPMDALVDRRGGNKAEIPPIGLGELRKPGPLPSVPGLRLPLDPPKPTIPSKVDLSIPTTSSLKPGSKNPLMQLRAQREARAPSPESADDIEEDIDEEIEVVRVTDAVTDSYGSSVGADASADSMALESCDHVERIPTRKGL